MDAVCLFDTNINSNDIGFYRGSLMGFFNKIKSFLDKGGEQKEKSTEAYSNDSFEDEAQERRLGPRVKAKEGSKVLIIDDSQTICTILKKMMEQNGYEPFTALDAETGIEIAKNESINLIFLDIVLPGIDGFAALRLLRKHVKTSHIPIIMMSGNHQATEVFYASRIGADDFLKKPFSRFEVFFRIEKMLDENNNLVRKDEL